MDTALNSGRGPWAVVLESDGRLIGAGRSAGGADAVDIPSGHVVGEPVSIGTCIRYGDDSRAVAIDIDFCGFGSAPRQIDETGGNDFPSGYREGKLCRRSRRRRIRVRATNDGPRCHSLLAGGGTPAVPDIV